MVFHGSRSIFMVLMVPLSRFVFHSSRLDFYGFSLFMVYGFYVFFMVPDWVFMVFMVTGGFNGFSWFQVGFHGFSWSLVGFHGFS